MSPHSPLRHYRPKFRFSLAAAALVALLVLLVTPAARAQIKQPGAHPDYSVEIEPHLVLQWAHEPFGDEGFGLGARFTIPFLDNGPIDRINNNMGIGFGFDWVHFDDPCFGPWWRGPRDPWVFAGQDCEATVLHFPVVLQWNFFLTPMISVFGEPGLEFTHTSYNVEWYCNGVGSPPCEFDGDDDVEVEFVFWGGARFMFSDTFGALVRVGTPYLSAGITLLL